MSWAPAAFVLVGAVSAGCASAPPPVVPVTVMVRGTRAEADQIERSLSANPGTPVELHFAPLPRTSSSGPSAAGPTAANVESLLSRARGHYVDGEFQPCLQALEGESLVSDLLASAQRALAARVLFWRVACQLAQGNEAVARETAHLFAVSALDLPPDVEAAAPDVEAAIAAVGREVAKQPLASLSLEANADRATFAVDGSPQACVNPCRIPVVPGNHVIAMRALGRMPETRTVMVSAPASTVAFTTTPATPEVASAQWTENFATPAGLDSDRSLSLLQQAARARRLALIDLGGTPALHLEGALGVDGAVVARASRAVSAPGSVGSDARTLLRDLLVRGHVVDPAPSLFSRPLFWIAVGVVAAGAATATYFVTRPPDQRTEIVF